MKKLTEEFVLTKKLKETTEEQTPQLEEQEIFLLKNITMAENLEEKTYCFLKYYCLLGCVLLVRTHTVKEIVN